MCILKEVTPSGSVGKQVFSTSEQRVLCGAILTAGASAATLVIRKYNASGETILTMKSGVNNSVPTPDGIEHQVTGLHVKVTPANALAYLLIE